MKRFLLVVLILHSLLEALVGLALVISPTSLKPDVTMAEISLLIVQGMCALSTVVLALWLIPYRRQLAVLTVGLGTLASFHSLIIVSLFITAPKTEELVGYSHHLLLAVAFWACWLRRDALADQ